jgi:hypothetical protein
MIHYIENSETLVNKYTLSIGESGVGEKRIIKSILPNVKSKILAMLCQLKSSPSSVLQFKKIAVSFIFQH